MPHRIAIGLFLFLSAVGLAAVAASTPDAPKVVHLPGGQFAYAMPHGSPVQFEKRMDAALLRFRGRFRIEGEYRYGRLSNDPKDDAAYDVIELTFVPDAAFRAVLPYWEGRGPVEELFIENEKDFLGKVVGASSVADIRSRKRLSVTGRAVIWVDHYTMAFDCDRPTYSVRFLKVDMPPTVVASNNLVQSGCL
jgi:hypothetical protein